MGPGSGESKQLVVPSAGSERPALRPAVLNLSNSPVIRLTRRAGNKQQCIVVDAARCTRLRT